ncbi:hypothetical protein VTI28DRAFT_494 [Corynascus sepedonium]
MHRVLTPKEAPGKQAAELTRNTADSDFGEPVLPTFNKDGPTIEERQGKALVGSAIKHGVKHFVYTSWIATASRPLTTLPTSHTIGVSTTLNTTSSPRPRIPP